jgi:phenylalanyl-tRNA synthetase alpha chain
MLHENVLTSSNIPIKSALAAGLGIDRIAMLKFGFTDIRDLYSNDFRILNQFRKGD